MTKYKVGFIGAGNMAKALYYGLIASKLFSPEQIILSSPNEHSVNEIKKQLGTNATTDNNEVVKNSNVVILAIKPQIIKLVIDNLVLPDTPPLFISILAGYSINRLESMFSKAVRVVRTMPNAPALVGKGVTSVSKGALATSEDVKTAKMIFSSVGEVYEIDEHLMNAVVGVSGSAPAYFYIMLEAMADAGVMLGLTRKNALMMAAHTALGSAKMIIETGEHPAMLRDMVTSPGGTTIEAVKTLEDLGFRSAVINAVIAAADKSKELGK